MYVLFDYEGLIEREDGGRKPRLEKLKEDDFRDSLDELEELRQGGRITVNDIQKLLAERFNCCYSR